MKITVYTALKWWSSLTPQETDLIMKKHFLPHIKIIHLSNQQIKVLYKKENKIK